MPWYPLALFLHIVGALGLFAGIALEQAALRGLRRAQSTGALREWLTIMTARRRIEAPSGLVLLVTGGYLASTWGRQAWIGLGLIGLVLIALLGIVLTGRAVKALSSELPSDDRPIALEVRQRIGSPMLRSGAALRAALALAIVFNMAVKPDASGAALALGVALVVGALAPWIGGRAYPMTREYGAER